MPYGGSKRTDTPLRSLALSLTHVARAALSEPYMLTIEHKQILLDRMPKVFDGFRIVQLSDVHHGPFQAPNKSNALSKRPTGFNPTLLR